MKTEIVLYKSIGGFNLTRPMVDRLDSKNFNWKEFNCPLPKDAVYASTVYWDEMNSFAFRSHPTFVEVIKELKYENDQLEFYEARRSDISKLKIIQMSLEFEVKDYFAGVECVTCNDVEIYR